MWRITHPVKVISHEESMPRSCHNRVNMLTQYAASRSAGFTEHSHASCHSCAFVGFFFSIFIWKHIMNEWNQACVEFYLSNAPLLRSLVSKVFDFAEALGKKSDNGALYLGDLCPLLLSLLSSPHLLMFTFPQMFHMAFILLSLAVYWMGTLFPALCRECST